MACVMYWNECEKCKHETYDRNMKFTCDKCKSDKIYTIREYDEEDECDEEFEDCEEEYEEYEIVA